MEDAGVFAVWKVSVNDVEGEVVEAAEAPDGDGKEQRGAHGGVVEDEKRGGEEAGKKEAGGLELDEAGIGECVNGGPAFYLKESCRYLDLAGRNKAAANLAPDNQFERLCHALGLTELQGGQGKKGEDQSHDPEAGNHL